MWYQWFYFTPSSSQWQLNFRYKSELQVVKYELQERRDEMTHEELLLFGERLHSRRNMLNFTQDFVSEKAGISLRFYQMIERGEKSVSLDTLIRLSDILTISVDYLLFGDLSNPLENPLTETLRRLSPQQREDAIKILQIYSRACETQDK